MKHTGWPWFFAWAIAGVGAGLQVSAIGILLLPLTLAWLYFLLRTSRATPEALGVLEGVAAVCFFVVAVNADYWTCPSSGEIVHNSGGSAVSIDSCGGLNPWPWLIVGLVLSVVAPLAYRRMRRQVERRAPAA